MALPIVNGQYLPGGAVAGAEVTNSSGGFKPKFPVHCRPMDFDSWKAFGESGNEQATTRCKILYEDQKLQPLAFSSESDKLCVESLNSYATGFQVVPDDEGSRRLFCNVANMNLDTQMVKMNHYLHSKLVSQALIVDHDVMMQFNRWYDNTNLKLYDMWIAGTIYGETAPKVTDACANAYGNYMCSNLLPNCTYMPYARWPYQDVYEQIYTCQEVCNVVQTACEAIWIPHEVRCKDLVKEEIDRTLDPNYEMSPFERREAGGHACSSVVMSVEFESGVSRAVYASLSTLLLTVAVVWYNMDML